MEAASDAVGRTRSGSNWRIFVDQNISGSSSRSKFLIFKLKQIAN
jgi:hypothetical protein